MLDLNLKAQFTQTTKWWTHDENMSVFRMNDHMKTQLVSAIHLQEVELQEKPPEDQQGTKICSDGEWDQ